jgi:hypothetical protein
MGEVIVHGSAAGFAQEISTGAHRLTSDEPGDAGGAGSGPSPYDLLFQKSVSEDVQSNAVTDARALILHFPALLDLMGRIGAQPIAEFGQEHLQTPAAQEDLLLGYWESGPVNGLTGTEAGRFFARVLLQPYAEYLALRGDIALGKAQPICPFCNARPVVAVLRCEGDGAKRWLLCSLCATEWQYRHVICPACGEENKENLPIYVAAEFDYIRVDDEKVLEAPFVEGKLR